MSRWIAMGCLLPWVVAGCASDGQDQRAGYTHPADLPRVRNVRPDVPNERATLTILTLHAHVRREVDLGEAWALTSTEGLTGEQVERWRANGIRVGVLDPVAMAKFLKLMPQHGGARESQIRAGRDPVALETTPTFSRPIEARLALGIDRDETMRLPAGRTQLLTDVALGPRGAAMVMSPHHHWVSDHVLPRTVEEKMFDGRIFRELELSATLPWDYFLVLGYSAPSPAPASPSEDEPKTDPRAAPPPSPPVQPTAEPDKPEPPPAPAPPKRGNRPAPTTPMLGSLLFTAERGGTPIQLVVFIRIPRRHENVQVRIRPEFEP